MADYAIHDTTLYDIADVIRKKDGSSALIDPADYAGRINLMGMLEEKTVSGSVVAFSDGADAVKLKSCAVTIAPNLDGVSSVDVVHGGGNIFSSEWEQGSINTSGNNQTNSNVIRTAGFIRVFEGIHYSFTRDITTDIINFRGYDAEQNYIGSGSTILNLITGYSVTNPMRTGDSTCTIEIKAGSGVAYIRMNDYSNDLSVKYTMCVGDTPLSQYSPYVSTTHTASLGRTIYGGTPDVVTGEGTETAGKAVLDPTETWLFSSAWSKTNTNVFYTQATHDEISFSTWNDNSILLCDGTLPVGTRNEINSADTNMIGVSGNVGHPCITVRIDKTTCPDLASFILYITNSQIPFVYKKATPEDFTFTPVPILSRLGDNTMWGDGDLSVIYRSSGTQTIIQPTLISKTITANGTYSAEDDGADGYDEVTVNVSGGGGNTPQATQTLICDNSALGSSLTFTDDYENYDLIKFVVYRSDIGNQFTFYMTPAMINAMAQYSSNRINFNQPYGNNFVCYTKTSNTAWTRYGVRNLAVKYVYGLTFTNCTVTETELYNRQGIGSSNVTFTPPTGETFFDYDYILLATCTGNSDETQVNLEVFQPDIEKDIFGSDNADENSVRVYKYNQGGTFVTVTENTITAFSYFYACGLKLSYNQQTLLGGFNSNSEQGEQENEIENELDELEQEESET